MVLLIIVCSFFFREYPKWGKVTPEKKFIFLGSPGYIYKKRVYTLRMAKTNPDILLLKRLRAGESAAFRTLYVDYYQMIRHLVLKNSGSEAEVGDLFQESVLILYELVRKPDFKLTASLRSFFYSVCRNQWLKQLRSKKKVRLVDFETVVQIPPLEDPEDLTERQRLILQECMKRLGESCRKLLEACYYLKKSMTEIAEEFQYGSANTAKTRKYKCLQQLKKLARAAMQ